MSFVSPSLYADMIVGRIVPSSHPTIQLMSVPGMSATDFDILSTGNYAFALGDRQISFFDGQKWSLAQEIEKNAEIWDIEFSYPDSAKNADAWAITSTDSLYYFNGSHWSKVNNITSILGLSKKTDDTGIETSNGYVFLIAETGKRLQGTSAIVYSVWSPLSNQWSKPKTLKNSYLMSDMGEDAAATYNDIAGAPTCSLFVYANADSQTPSPEFVQINASGSYALFSSPLLPKFTSEESSERRFFIDKSGAYMLLESPDNITYLWYNHSSIAAGWHATQLPMKPLLPGPLLAGQVASGVACNDLDMGNNEMGLSCINTLSKHPKWSDPVTIPGVSLPDDQLYTQSNGTWLSYTANPPSEKNHDAIFYNMSSEEVTDTDFPGTNFPNLKQLSDKEMLACAYVNNSLDKLFFYNSDSTAPAWKAIKNSGKFRGCNMSYSDFMLTNYGGAQETWLFNTKYSSNFCRKLKVLRHGHMRAYSSCKGS